MADGVNSTGSGTLRAYVSGAFCLASLLAGMLLWSPSAHAQFNPFRGYRGPALTGADFDAGRAAARKLLERNPPAVGQTEKWTGPNTGNEGTFTIREIFERSGMPCRTVASEVVLQRTQRMREYTLKFCRVATGEWRLAD